MRTKSTHRRDFSLEAFDNRSDGSDLVAKSRRRSPIYTVAPARIGAAEGSNNGREAKRSELVIIGQRRRSIFRRREEGGSRD